MSIDSNDPSPICIDNLPLACDRENDDCLSTNLKSLAQIQPKYANLIREFPEILKNNFKKDPKHGVFHRIPTNSDAPVKAKVRPLLALEV